MAGTIAECSRALVRNHSEWAVPSSNPGEGCYGDDELIGSRIASFPHMAINNWVANITTLDNMQDIYQKYSLHHSGTCRQKTSIGPPSCGVLKNQVYAQWDL